MKRRTKFIAVGASTIVAVAAAGGIAVATTADDDQPLTGDTYDRAVAAATAHVGDGEVTETEVGDDGAAYEVEMTLVDGSDVEVQLDADFAVIGTEVDDDSDEPTDAPTP